MRPPRYDLYTTVRPSIHILRVLHAARDIKSLLEES
jgi:plasmid stabilization system protein ParE